MNAEQVIEHLRNYRVQNRRFDQLVRVVMSNELAAKLVQASVSAAVSASRSSGRAPGSRGYDTVFFIVGEMRSGTSWLRRTLSSHPEIACGHEGSFFGRDYSREDIPVYTDPVSSLARALAVSKEFRVWHGLPWNQWGDDYQIDVRNLTRLSVDYFLLKEVRRTGKRIVGDKSPQHTAHLDEIHQVYPDAQIIHIVRDGRDVAVSAMHHWWRLAKDRPGGVYQLTTEELGKRDAYLKDREEFLASGESIFTEERLGQLARRWSHRVGKARRDGTALYGDRYLEIRYEDFLRDAPTTLFQMLEFLRARRGEYIVERCIQHSSFERASNRQHGEEDSHSFFRKGVAGDWKSVFTERDRKIYEEFAGDQLAEIGYETSYTW